MKYRIKDYEDIRTLVNSMSIDDLFRSVVCPNYNYIPGSPITKGYIEMM